jgi:hypothetical protein
MTRLLKICLPCVLVLFLSETAGSAEPNASPSSPQETPAAKPKAPTYSRGLGDNLNTLHWTVCFGHMPSTGYQVDTTYPEALSMYRQIYNFTNGTHQVGYALGQDWGRFNSCPDLPEDFKPPLGDGKPGSGYANYRQLTKDVHPYNAEMGQFLDDGIAGSDDPVSDKYKSLDSKGEWKIGWKSWRNISFRNRIDDGTEWAMLDGFVRNFGMNHSVFEDAFIYDIKNESTALGGKITTDDQEWAAALEELDYLWNKHGISAFTEFERTVYQGRVWGFWGCSNPSDEVCLNTWGNSVIFMNRTLNDTAKDMASS